MKFLKPLTVFAILSLSVFQLSAQSNLALQKAFQNSYYEESKKNYNKAINHIIPFYEQGNYETNLRIGWLYYLAKNYHASQSYYTRAVNLRSNSIEAKFGLVKPLSFLGSWDKVIDQYKAILKIDPQNKQANYWLGVMLYNKKQYATSAKYFAKVVNAYPFDYDGNHMLAWSLLFLGRKAEAKASFERALLVKPGDFSSNDGFNKALK